MGAVLDQAAPIGVTIILLFCAALAWAWWGTIDIVASATGKIVPSGRTKVIQPFETGVVPYGRSATAAFPRSQARPAGTAGDRVLPR
jgi:hypothetical protein